MRKIAYAIVTVIVIIVILMTVSMVFKICPPPGPYPSPPGCGGAAQSTCTGCVQRDDMGCFPPSCDLMPEYRAKVICEMFKTGETFANWPTDCNQMPTPQCARLCEAEKQRVHNAGLSRWNAGIKNNNLWWEKPYTKVFSFGSVTERYEGLHADARAWGAGSVKDTSLQTEADFNHYFNMSYIAGYSFQNYEIYDGTVEINAYDLNQVPISLQKGIRRNLEGELVRDSDILYGPKYLPTNKTGFLFNAIVPEFRNDIIHQLERDIDSGADGLILDNVIIIPAIKTLPTYFDEYTLSKFDQHLISTLKPEDWQAAGADPSTFSYAKFLREKGFSSQSFAGNDWKKIPFILEFRRFVSSENENAFRSIANEVRAYAGSKNRSVTLSANMANQVGDIPIEPVVDYVTTEFGFLPKDPPYRYVTVVPLAKIYNAKGKTLLNVLWAGSYWSMQKVTEKNRDAGMDVYRQAIMESYAAKSSHIYLRAATSNVIMVYPDPIDQFKAGFNTSDVNEVSRAYNFMRTHREYFADFGNSNAKAAIVYSNTADIDMFLSNPDEQHIWETRGIGEQLYRQGVDYDVIAPGSSLSRYSVVVLPEITRLTDSESDWLLDFVNSGGTLVLLNNPQGKLRDIRGGVNGKGRVIIMNPGDFPGVAATVKSIAGSIATDPQLAAISYTNGNNASVIHFFNLEFTAETGFPVKRDVTVTAVPFLMKGQKVYYSSLEHPEPVELTAERIVLPEIKTYGILIVQ